MPLPAPDPWTRQIARRVAYLWPLKAVGTMVFMGIFFWAYFSVLRAPLGVPSVMPLTVVDRWIPFSVHAFPAYASLWVYASLTPALLREFRPLASFGLWMAAMCLFCLGVFWLYPTMVPAPDIDWALYPEMSVLKGVDASGNACPSLHVASAVFTAIWLNRILRSVAAPPFLDALNWALCLAILWSTIATRQHVVIDVLAGGLVGVTFALLALRQVFGSLRAAEI